MESLQSNATLAITEAIGGSSTAKIYEGIGLDSLKSIRWHRKMGFLYKVLKSESPSYVFNTITNSITQRHKKIGQNSSLKFSFFVKHEYFKDFFTSATTEWNKLDW